MGSNNSEKTSLLVSGQGDIEITHETAVASASVFQKTLISFLPKRFRPRTRPVARKLPQISPDRLSQSLKDQPLIIEKYGTEVLSSAGQPQETVLYLAYGSNLCHETFQGRRGIKPVAQVNVVVPELRLTFDLPGIAYAEPCFANTARRDVPSPPLTSPSPSEHTPLLGNDNSHQEDYHKDRWKKGLVGVVYEVTPTDYAHIIATEGGGSSYQDILVDCHVLPPGSAVPLNPTTPAFKAHTLFSPSGTPPPNPGDPPPTLWRNGRYHRPDPSYAQPSARYKKLITDGAAEHGLPAEYQEFLRGIRPYRITTAAQRVGAFVFMTLWAPLVFSLFFMMDTFQDKKGRSPQWLMNLTASVFGAAWESYDAFFRGTFGDGERTIGDDDDSGIGDAGSSQATTTGALADV